MARRKKSSTLEDVFELVAMLPWWLGVVIAMATYALLHALAGRTGPSAAQILLAGLAGVFQFMIPLVCLCAAAASAFKARQRQSLVQGVTTSRSAASLEGMSWLQFEALVGEAFRQKGFKVLELGGAGPDGGVDLVLTKGNEKFLVQCKQWKAFKVGVGIVRELYGVMASNGATGGFVVTSGKFTQDAQQFARGRNVTLIDGDRLFAMLQSARAGMKTAKLPPTAPAPGAPACPVCGSPMAKRESKRGPHSGSLFWGCSTFPKCRGTLKM